MDAEDKNEIRMITQSKLFQGKWIVIEKTWGGGRRHLNKDATSRNQNQANHVLPQVQNTTTKIECLVVLVTLHKTRPLTDKIKKN